MPLYTVAVLQNELRSLLNESNVTEFKWKELKSAQFRFAAEKMIRFSIGNALEQLLRVDVLIWDIEDARHKIRGRDDAANLQAMYRYLFRNVLQRRWPRESTWHLYPDEQTAIQWNTIHDYLDLEGTRLEISTNTMKKQPFRFTLVEDFNVLMIEPCDSKSEIFVQLADLFAGMGVFSYAEYDLYEKWLEMQNCDLDALQEIELSRSRRERFCLLNLLDVECKQHKLTVSLKTFRGLRTRNPYRPINFWFYEPQRSEDVAPVR
jgi:hypothetical protein